MVVCCVARAQIKFHAWRRRHKSAEHAIALLFCKHSHSNVLYVGTHKQHSRECPVIKYILLCVVRVFVSQLASAHTHTLTHTVSAGVTIRDQAKAFICTCATSDMRAECFTTCVRVDKETAHRSCAADAIVVVAFVGPIKTNASRCVDGQRLWRNTVNWHYCHQYRQMGARLDSSASHSVH